MSKDWFLRRGTKALGPLGVDEIRASLQTGALSPSELVWSESEKEWRAARDWEAFRGPWPDRQVVALHDDQACVWIVVEDPTAQARMTGPWSWQQIRGKVDRGEWTGQELIWSQGMSGWAILNERPEFKAPLEGTI